jgi:Rps23 Pro-64 3,4-dihydroxylase Tpa1-like proline 4-hydroxylase
MKFINDTIMDFLTIEKVPFPHVIIDNFIKEEYLEELLGEMGELSRDKSYYNGNQNYEKNKFAFKDNLKKNLNDLFEELNSDEFISKLETYFEIDSSSIVRNNLDLQGAGIHKVYNEGFLCMHSDFESYFDKKINTLLDRRLNLLLYMNPKWKKEYGGELYLYDKNIATVTKEVVPILNRCIIFVTPGNIHGHPKKLTIPDTMCRQSITTYYYTVNTTGKNLLGEDCKSVIWYSKIK